jgi:CRISPR/Cas system-associated protein Csm6
MSYLLGSAFFSRLVSFMSSLPQPIFTPVPQAAKDDSSSLDKLIDTFDRIEHFFRRLETYIRIEPSMATTKLTVEIMAEVLNILALATKELKRERLSELISHKSIIFYSYIY